MRPVTRSPFSSVMTSVLARSEAPTEAAAKVHKSRSSRPSAMPLPLRLNGCPAVVRVELFDRRRGLSRLRAKVALPHHAVLIDDERHDTARAVGRRIGEHGKSAGELPVAQIVFGAPGCR